MDKYIPLSVPNFEGNERKYVDDAIDKVWVSTGGAYITEFEEKIADFIGVENVAACQSGTSAIHLSLVEAGVGWGDLVIVPALTFIAAVNPVAYQGAKPIFMDCDESLCIDPIKLNEFCENECEYDGVSLKYKGSSIKAIIVVHVFGNMADMETIMDIAKRFNLIVVEDATEALGTYYTEGRFKGKYAGTIGHFGCFSFNGNKIITTGGGGAVTSIDSSIVDHIRFISTQAKTDPLFYCHDEIGYNYRMTNIQAAIGVAQMEELSEFIKRKKVNYDIYYSEFADNKYCCLLPFRSGINSNKWFYSLVINRDYIKISMKEIVNELKKLGIESRPIWGLINEQKPYLNNYEYQIEKAHYYADRVLNIPCSTNIKKEDVFYVANSIKTFFESIATN